MNTLAYILILIALLIVRGVTKGRSITDIPHDLGDMFIALTTSDTAQMKEVLSRTGDTNDATVSATAETTVTQMSPNDISNGAFDPHTKDGLIAFGKKLQSMGYQVSENPAFGGVTKGAHVANSQHYIGEAIDVNADHGFKGGEKAALDNACRYAKDAGFKTIWQAPGHYDHLHVAVKH